MSKKWRKLLAVIMVIILVIGSISGNRCLVAEAEDRDRLVDVKITVNYGQTEARRMLDMINDFRQGDEAWAWDENNTDKIIYSDLGALKIDPVLEQVAMLRAAEIALSYNQFHFRPNGKIWSTAYSPEVRGGSIGENLAAGSGALLSTAESVFQGWKEDDETYLFQGHRRNMLGKNYVSVGIGHVEYQGYHY